jgi:hypothetical protein
MYFFFFYSWSSNPYFHVEVALTNNHIYIYVSDRKNVLKLFKRIQILKRKNYQDVI